MGCTNSKSTDVVESVGPRPTANPAGNTSTLTATVEINGTTKSNGAKVPHETNGVEIKQHEHPTQPNSNGMPCLGFSSHIDWYLMLLPLKKPCVASFSV